MTEQFKQARRALESALDDFAENAGLPNETIALDHALKRFWRAALEYHEDRERNGREAERQCREDDARLPEDHGL